MDLITIWQHLTAATHSEAPPPDLQQLRDWTRQSLPPAAAESVSIQNTYIHSDPGVNGYILGILPPLLDGTDCVRSDTMRLEIAVVWSMTPFPWSSVQPALEESLHSSDRRLRLFAMEQIANRALERFLHAPPPEWVFAALQECTTDPDPDVSQYAVALQTALRNNQLPTLRPTGCNMSLMAM